MSSVYSLIDVNNFYASCERIFNPKLNNKPVVILSNNDGCVISRSNEAKALGIPMGAPFFEYQKLCKDHSVAIFSSNYRLYGDISNRVMSSLRQLVSELEIYSIDEAFFKLSSFPDNELLDYIKYIKTKITTSTGVPVSIGVATTKTLAKVANYIAKKKNIEIFDLRNTHLQNKILSSLAVEDIWGIGKRLALRLKNLNIHTAIELRDANPKLIRKSFGVVGEKIVLELRGIACYDLEILPKQKKNIVTARSFGKAVTEFTELEEALTNYCASAAVKMRAQNTKAQSICVFLVTNFYSKEQPFYKNSHSFWFDLATDNTMLIASTAKRCLKKIFKKGLSYKKVGIILLDLIDSSYNQTSLFTPLSNTDKASQIMKVMDNINKKIGKNTIFLASQGIERLWQMRSFNRSPNYTTDWNQLIQVK